MSSNLSIESTIRTTDVGAIWNAAVVRYEAITSIKISTLAGAKNVDDILREITLRETTFSQYRHNDSKLDKFRTSVKNNLVLVEMWGDIVSKATRTVRNLQLPGKHELWTAYFYDIIVLPSG